MFKLTKALIKLITELFSTTTAHRDHVLIKIVTIYMRTLPAYLMS